MALLAEPVPIKEVGIGATQLPRLHVKDGACMLGSRVPPLLLPPRAVHRSTVGAAIPHLLHHPSEGNAVERLNEAVLGVDGGHSSRWTAVDFRRRCQARGQDRRTESATPPLPSHLAPP